MLLDVQFFTRKSKNTGYCTIYCHISIDKKRTKSPFSTGIKIPVNCWDKVAKKITCENYDIEASELQRIKTGIHQLFIVLENSGKSFSPDYLKEVFTSKSLLKRNIDYKVREAIDLYFESYRLNKTKTEGTKIRVKQYAKRAKEFLGDVEVVKFEEYHIDNFYYYLTNKYNNSHNVAVRAIEFLQKSLEVAHKKGHIEYVPCYGYKIKRVRNEKKTYLTKTELVLLEQAKFLNKNLETVRDVFVFCCYTGLDFGDSKAFNADWIKSSEVGEHIDYNRTKTDFKGLVPFYPAARYIAEKYNYNLPVYTNQHHNRMIKLACYMAGINEDKAKLISTHSARVTAGMVWLNEGIRIEVVSKMLGHASIQTTQRYYADIELETVLKEARKVG